MRHQMRLHLGHEVHCHDDDDEERCTTEVKRNVPAHDHEFREKAHEGDVSGAEHRKPRHHPVDVSRRLLARSTTRNECTRLSQVIRRFLGIEYQCGVKETEKDDRRSVQHDINRLPRLHRRRQVPQPRHPFRTAEPSCQGSGKENDARCEDWRYHPSHVQLQRQVTALARIDPASHLPSRIIDRNPSLASFDEHHEPRHCEGEREQYEHHEDVQLAGSGQLQGTADRGRKPRHDSREDDDGYAVAYASLADLLAEPHEEYRPCHQRGDRRDSETPAGVHDHLKRAGLLRFECNRNPEGLKHREGHGAVSRISRDLPAARLSFLPKLLQTRVHVRKELHDDGCRDIRHDSDCKNGESFQRSPRKHVEHVEDCAPLLLEQHLQGNGINPRHRNERADSEHDQCAENEQQALLELGRRSGGRRCSGLELSLCHVRSVLDSSASRLDRAAGAPRHRNAGDGIRPTQRGFPKDLRLPDILRNHAGRLQ